MAGLDMGGDFGCERGDPGVDAGVVGPGTADAPRRDARHNAVNDEGRAAVVVTRVDAALTVVAGARVLRGVVRRSVGCPACAQGVRHDRDYGRPQNPPDEGTLGGDSPPEDPGLSAGLIELAV